jgi:hypothetical protein
MDQHGHLAKFEACYNSALYLPGARAGAQAMNVSE